MPLDIKRVEARKTDLKLSNRQIGEAINVSDNTVGRWLRGESQPTSINLGQLAEVLKTSNDFLLGLKDDPTPPLRSKADLTSKEFQLIDAYRHGDWQRLMRLLGDDE
jgi:repressor LexA